MYFTINIFLEIGVSMVAARFITATLVGLLLSLTPTFALAKAPMAKSILWEISGKGLNKPSYLFGTLQGCTNVIALSKQQKQSVRQVQQLYTEYNEEAEIPMTNFSTDLAMPNGQTLWDVLATDEFPKVKRFFEGPMQVPMSSLKKLRPYAIAILIGIGAPKPKKTCKETSSEALLSSEAKKYKIPQQYLENTGDVAKTFNNIPIRDEVNLLINTIDELQPTQGNKINWTKYLARSKSVEARMYRQYVQQDINAFANSSAFLTDVEIRLFTGLLEPHNRLWIPRMKKAMQDKSTFFGVGVDHLGGENGLIPLLQKEGYTVRPIFNKN
jgi:uncharacterized protein